MLKHYTIMVVDGQDLSDVSSCISSISLNKDVVRTEEVVLTEDVNAIVIEVISNAEKILKFKYLWS